MHATSSSSSAIRLPAAFQRLAWSNLAAPAIARRLAFGRVLIIGPSCGLLASLVMVATLAAPLFWLATASFFLLGAGPILWVVGSTTLRQAITPERMIGRVSALIFMSPAARLARIPEQSAAAC